ncbi:MAG: hypothetical protein Q4E70_03540 [Candidatus Saccharibacteria bacterium]|nr:hypothetical protein [Candidatus Saccharibacteria bacterium]
MALKKSIKNVIAGSALLASSMATPSVFADGGISPIPYGFDGRPQFELSLIDLTNNKLDFGVTQPRLSSPVANMGAWIVDETEAGDVSELTDEDLIPVFWTDNIENYYKYVKDTTKHYVSRVEVNLLESSTGKMFYMAELMNGTIWAQLIDYSACLSGWTEGKACAADTFEKDSDWNITEINYALVDVEVDTEEPVEEPTEEPIEEPIEEPVEEPVEGPVEEPNEELAEAETAEAKTAEVEVVTSETSPSTKEVVEVVKTVYLSNNSNDDSVKTVEEAEKAETLETTETSSEEETTEAEEETLEIPELGKKIETENILNNLSWILFFVSGALLGTVSTWFLLSDHHKMNQRK